MKKLFAIIVCFLMLLPITASVFAVADLSVVIQEGDLFAGTAEIIVSGVEDPAVSVDGKSVEVRPGVSVLSFTAVSMDTVGGTLHCGKETYTAISQNGSVYSMPFDRKSFLEEDVVLTYVPASTGFEYGSDIVYGEYNLDDQNISQAVLTLPNGSKITPDYVILHYPEVGSYVIREEREAYSAETVYGIGDGWNAETNMGGSTPGSPVYISFGFSALGKILSEDQSYIASFDTKKLSDGEHILSVASDGIVLNETKFLVDNTAPEITLALSFGEALTVEDSIGFSAADLSGEVKLYADIDGERYRPGDTLSYVSPGKHLFTVTATDVCGNISMVCAEFRLCEPSAAVEEGLEKQTAVPVMEGDAAIYTYQIGDNQKFSFEYLGSTNENGLISVSAYDYAANAYEEIGVAESGVRTVFEIEDGRFIQDGEVLISVQPKLYISSSDTAVWITDTQYYSNYEDLNHVYELMLNYSVELYQKGQAGYLLHTGDIVDTHYDTEKAKAEWLFASEVHKILDESGMPNGVLAGNHDTGNTPPVLDNYKKYFGKRRYRDNLWYGGTPDNNGCHYDLVTIGGNDLLFMYLSNGVEVTDLTVAWANAVCKAYPNRTVILCVHPYLDVTGDYVYNPKDPNAYNNSRAYEIAEKIITPNENIAAVLCGHVHGAKRVQRDFGNGRYVWEILSDYQYAELGVDPQHEENGCSLDGEGYLRLITFGENGLMKQTTYSPLHADYNFFAEEEDTFEVTLQTAKGGVTLQTQEANLYFAAAKPAIAQPEPKSGLPAVFLIVGFLVALDLAGTVIVVLVKKRRKLKEHIHNK